MTAARDSSMEEIRRKVHAYLAEYPQVAKVFRKRFQKLPKGDSDAEHDAIRAMVRKLAASIKKQRR
jgi:hypothetical protein